jgi:hypothetical protein
MAIYRGNHMLVQTLSHSLTTELGGPQESPLVSLEDRLIDAFANAAIGSGNEVSSIERLVQSPDITSPEALAQLQERMGQYNVDINLLNVLVRKAVGTAETLLRAS